MSPAEKRAWRGYENRIFTLLVLLMAVPVLVVGALAGVYSAHLQATRQNLMLESAQSSAESQINAVLTDLRTYYLSAVGQSSCGWLKRQTEPPYAAYSEVSAVQELLRGGDLMDSYVSSYAYIDLRNGWVLSNTGMYRFSAVKNFEQLSAFVQEQSGRTDELSWINNTALPAADNGNYTVDLSGYLLVLRSTTAAGELTGLLAVRVNTAPLLALAASWSSLHYQVALVESETGAPILATDAAFAGQLGGAPLAPGLHTWEQWRLCAGETSVNGVRLYAAADKNEVWNISGTILLISVIVTLCTALVLAVCRWSSAVLYRPVRDLMAAVSEVFGQRGSNQDEFAYLATGAAQLAQDRRQLRYMAALQRQKLCEQFMLHLLRGEVSQAEIERSMRELAVRQSSFYRLLAARVEAGPDASATERETLAMSLVQRLPQEVTDSLFLRPLNVGALCFLAVGADSEAELEEKVRFVCGRTQELVRTLFGRGCRIGASLPFGTPAHTSAAYFEALEAARGGGQPGEEGLSFYTLPDLNRTSGGYDMVLQNEITDAVYNCNRKEAERLIELFVARMKENGARSYERRFYQQRLTGAILAVAENAGLSVSQILSRQEKGLFQQIDRIYDGATLQALLIDDVAVPVMELLTDYRQNNAGSDLAKKVIALIKETGGDITLNECAERLNYHPSYIWKVLKSERETNFTDLVNAQKLEMAKELLMTTDLTVAQIAETLHYSNVQNFIRFFNREVGMTPGKYRKDHRAAAK